MSKKIKNSKLNSTHLLDDDSEIEDNNDVNWTVKSNNASEEEPDKNKNKNKNEDDEDDEDYYDYKDEDNEDIVENIVLPTKKKNKKNSEPEINIEIIKGEKNEKCVQITIKMALENKTKDIITIDFTINKKTFLKIAKELK